MPEKRHTLDLLFLWLLMGTELCIALGCDMIGSRPCDEDSLRLAKGPRCIYHLFAQGVNADIDTSGAIDMIRNKDRAMFARSILHSCEGEGLT